MLLNLVWQLHPFLLLLSTQMEQILFHPLLSFPINLGAVGLFC